MDRHDTHLLSCSSSIEHSYKFDKNGNIISDSVSDMVAFSKVSNKKKYKISDIFENLNKENNNIIQEEDIHNNNKNSEKEITINKNNYKIKEINISNSNIGKDNDKDKGKKLINANKNKIIINKDEKNIDKKLENNTILGEDKNAGDDNMEKEHNINGNKNILYNKDNNMTLSQIKKDQNEKHNLKDDNRDDISKDRDKNEEKIEKSKEHNEIGEEKGINEKNYTKNENSKNINNNGNNFKVIQSNETFMYSPYEKGNIKYKIKSNEKNEIEREKENENEKGNKNDYNNSSFNYNIIKKEAEYTYSLKKYDDKILKEINVSCITLKSTKSKTKYIKEKNKDKDKENNEDEVNNEDEFNNKESNNLAKENLKEVKYEAKYIERMKFSSKTSPFLSSINNMVKEKEMLIEKTVIEKYLKLPMNDFCYMIKSPLIINYKKSLTSVKNNFYFVSKEIISMDKYKNKIMRTNFSNDVNKKKVKESIMFDQFNSKANLNKVIKDKFKLNNDKEDGNKFIIDEIEENLINNKNNISTQNNDYLNKNMKEKMSIIRKNDNNEYNKDADDLSFINKNLKNKNIINQEDNDEDNDDGNDDNRSKEENNVSTNNKINNIEKENLIENNNLNKNDTANIGDLDKTNNLRNKRNINTNNNRLINNNFENNNNNEDKFDEYSEVKSILEKYQNDNSFNIKNNNNNDISYLNNNQTQINNIKKKNLLSPKKIIQKSNNSILKPLTNIKNIKNTPHKVPNSAYLTPLPKNKNLNTNYRPNNMNDTTNKISRITSPLTINNNHIRERRLFNDSNLPNVKKLKFQEKKNRNRSLINILNHKDIDDDYSPSHKKENSPQNYCIHLEEELKSNSKSKYKRHFRNEQNCPICVALQLKNKLLEEKSRMLPALTKTNFRKVCDHEYGNKSPNKEIMKTIYPITKERSLIRVGSGTNVLTTRKKVKRRNESVKQIRRIEITNNLLNEEDNNKEKFPVIKDYFNINNV